MGTYTAHLVDKVESHRQRSNEHVFAGFLVIVARQLTAVQTPDAMIRSFEIFDADLKGYVTTGEFRSIMSKLGMGLAAQVL
jgi:Ca2+-binding EF-hand superfamily protein